MSRPRLDAGWEAGELGLDFAKREASRLLRRSRPRLVWILLFSLLVTGGFVGLRLLRTPKREASLTMRVVEAEMEQGTELRPARSYLDYIWGVFLSGPNLTKIIERHKLYPDRYARDPRLAVEAMRDELDVECWRNYFVWEHYQVEDELRSVRFSITWPSHDPQQALEVVRELRDMIVEAQTEERRHVFELGQQDLGEASDEAVARLAAVRGAIALRRREQHQASPARLARLGVELHDLVSEQKTLKERVEQMGNTRTHFELTAAWERQHSGLRFETVDPGYVLPRKGGGAKALVASGLLVFVGVAFLCGLVVGAFEVKIRQPSDVVRLGIPLLGALPPHPGDNTGTLTERLYAEDRLRLEAR